MRKVTHKKKPIIQIKEILINVVDEAVTGVEVVEDVMDVVMVIKGDWREETQTNNNNNNKNKPRRRQLNPQDSDGKPNLSHFWVNFSLCREEWGELPRIL